MATKPIWAAFAMAASLMTSACVDLRGASGKTDGLVATTLLVPDSGPAEISFSRQRRGAAAATPAAGLARGGDRVESVAQQIIADLRQGGDARAVSAFVSAEALSRDLERLQRHVASAWHFDLDPSAVAFLRVRLRAAIAADGSVRAIELIDSHGGPEDVLARFVEEAIATLDWSSPLPLDGGAEPLRALVFRFEMGRAGP